MALLLSLYTLHGAAAAAPSSPRSASFDASWRFRRGECHATTCAAPAFDDSTWRSLAVPHDWSRKDLPPRSQDAEFPVLGARYGRWKLQAGDDEAWAAPGFDDSAWQNASGGVDWRAYGGAAFNRSNATGWYRQRLDVPALLLRINSDARNFTNATVTLALGLIAGANAAYVNGQKVGASAPQRGVPAGAPSLGYYNAPVQYVLPRGLLKGGGRDVLALRVQAFGGAATDSSAGAPAAASPPPPYPPPGPLPAYGGLYDNPLLMHGHKEQRVGPFDAAVSPGVKSTGFTLGGGGWYRKSFSLASALNLERRHRHSGVQKRIFLRFDGVYMNAEVFVNGRSLGSHPYGYTAFEHDITAYLSASSTSGAERGGAVLDASAQNVLAVRVDNGGKNSRWYSGSGIFRHVWLTALDPVHVPLWGVSISTPSVTGIGGATAASAVVAVAVDVRNAGTHAVSATVSAAVNGSAAAAKTTLQVPANSTATATLSITLTGAALWAPSHPVLHDCTVTIAGSDSSADSMSQRFGVRTISFNNSNIQQGNLSSSAFLLNGVATKMRGGCVHHANGPLGSMAIDRAEERRVQALKSAGYNAIRTSHNPPSEAFLDACDRLGVLVMDEAFDCWSQGKNPEDYHLSFDAWWQRDLAAMVKRDRNHPAVVMWSIGNEIPMRFTKAGENLSVVLSQFIKANDAGGADSGRAITSAYPMLNDQDSPFLHNLGVPGYNYAGWTGPKDVYGIDHKKLPDRTMVGTESLPKTSAEQWQRVWSKPYVVGDFIWTAIDYLGETAIGSASVAPRWVDTQHRPFPWHVSYCGDFDLTLAVKPQGVFRQVLWNVTAIGAGVHHPQTAQQDAFNVSETLTPWGWPDEVQHWTWPGHEGERLQVRLFAKHCVSAYASMDGGKTKLATAAFNASNFTAVLHVPYEAGELKLVATGCVEPAQSGEAAADKSLTLRTAGAPAKLSLCADRSSLEHSPNDLAFVTATVLDANGGVVPERGQANVSFSLGGGGGAVKLIAVGSGDPTDPSSFTAAHKVTWRGRALAVVQPDASAGAGAAVLRAEAEGLAAATITITTRAVEMARVF